MNTGSSSPSSPLAPRPPQHQEHNRWQLPDIHTSRDKNMSIDFQQSNTHSLYSQPDIDQSFIHTSNSSSPTHTQLNSLHHPFDQSEPMDTADHHSYGLFSDSSSSAPFTSQHYRTNASSSSSLGPPYGINSKNMYTHPSFTDPAFNGSNGNTYDIMSGISSGKVSPLTPADSVNGLHHSPAFPQSGKEYPPSAFGDIHERRLPNVGSNGYQSEYPDEFSMGNLNNGLSFGPSAMQQFQDRLGRFPSDRYAHQGGPPVPSHIPNGHNSDLMRGVAPQATHSFRDGGLPGYEDMPHYLGPSHPEMRMHAVDETLARMKLQGHPIMGASNDLQTFIR
jgi:recombining binding protein suppressor of hairless